MIIELTFVGRGVNYGANVSSVIREKVEQTIYEVLQDEVGPGMIRSFESITQGWSYFPPFTYTVEKKHDGTVVGLRVWAPGASPESTASGVEEITGPKPRHPKFPEQYPPDPSDVFLYLDQGTPTHDIVPHHTALIIGRRGSPLSFWKRRGYEVGKFLGGRQVAVEREIPDDSGWLEVGKYSKELDPEFWKMKQASAEGKFLRRAVRHPGIDARNYSKQIGDDWSARAISILLPKIREILSGTNLEATKDIRWPAEGGLLWIHR